MTRPASPLTVALEGAPNFRDLGGLPAADGRTVRPGLVFRSQGLTHITAADLATLKTLRLGLICDLRSRREREQHPTPIPADWPVERMNCDLRNDPRSGERGLLDILREQPDAAGAQAMMLATYRAMPRAVDGTLAPLFDWLLSAGDRPVLIHCTAGKDRTGFVTAVLLAALTVPWPHIVADYMRTLSLIDRARLTVTTADIMAMLLGERPSPALIDGITDITPRYLAEAFAAIDQDYGSLDAYLQDVGGLSPARRIRLADRLLLAGP